MQVSTNDENDKDIFELLSNLRIYTPSIRKQSFGDEEWGIYQSPCLSFCLSVCPSVCEIVSVPCPSYGETFEVLHLKLLG